MPRGEAGKAVPPFLFGPTFCTTIANQVRHRLSASMTMSFDGNGLSERKGPPFDRKRGHPESLAHYILELVQLNRNGEFTAIDRYGRRRSATYGAMFERARSIAGSLQKDHAHGQRAAILCFDGTLDFICCAWACLLSGIDVLPLDTAAAFSNPAGFNRKLSKVLRMLGNPLVLADREIGRAIEPCGEQGPTVVVVDINDLHGGKPGGLPVLSHHSDLLISTSGTGGDPKIAVLENSSVVNRFYDGLRQDGRVCLYNMAHHSVAGVRLLLPIGRRVVYLHPLRLAVNPRDWFQAIEDFSVTDLGLSSSMASILCKSVNTRGPETSVGSLERISFGAEVIVPRVIKELIGVLKARGASDCLVSLVYSMTETGPVYRSTRRMSDLLRESESGPEAIALDDCVPGWSVRLVDDSGRSVRSGQPGTIQVSSKSKLFSGYFSKGLGTLPVQSADRWFDTGDIAVMLDGRLTLKGREKSTIIVNARKITCEEIEAHLATSDDFAAITTVAAPYRTQFQSTDEIAVFLVHSPNLGRPMDEIISLIIAMVAKEFSLTVRHVVPIAESDIERTATMKVRRDALMRKYSRGELQNHAGYRAARSMPMDERRFLRLWQEALGLAEPPRMDENFFDLGGDSLGGVELISAVEANYAILVATDEFFRDPTPRRLMSLVRRSPARGLENSEDDSDVIRSIAAFVGSWEGGRLLSDSMVVGFNADGNEQPIFWVFQSYAEAAALAAALGPNQPLYAMRSAVEILRPIEYSETKLRRTLDKYLWEILALSNGRAFSLGGNCQGGIVALMLARQLQTIRREPALLILLEWSFDYGVYQGPVRVLLGNSSHLCKGLDGAALKGRFEKNFPASELRMVPGAHGEFFRPENVTHLSSELRPGSKRHWKNILEACRALMDHLPFGRSTRD